MFLHVPTERGISSRPCTVRRMLKSLHRDVHQRANAGLIPTPPLGSMLKGFSMTFRSIMRLILVALKMHIYTVDRPRFLELNALLVDPP